MKTLSILVLSFTLFALNTAHAERPTSEMNMIVRALINTDVVKALKAENTSNLEDYKIDTSSKNINKYVLKFTRACHCVPKTLTVTIIENMLPTHSDGAPEYEVSIETSSGRGGTK